MTFDEMNEAVKQAQQTLRMADVFTHRMATMIAGRLQKADVYHDTLVSLKKELENYNMHTRSWKDKS